MEASEEWEKKDDPFPQAKESLYERYLAPFRRGIPEDARGYNDGFVDSPYTKNYARSRRGVKRFGHQNLQAMQRYASSKTDKSNT